MRRPAIPPEIQAATIRRRTAQGLPSDRVPSAYPVPRVRLPRILGGLKGKATGPVLIYPDAIIESLYEPPTAPVSWVGGAGDSTLRDSDDATYMTSEFIPDTVAPIAHQYGWITATFEAKALPFTAITAISLTVRARSSVADQPLAWDLAGDIEPSGGFNPFYASSKPVLTTSWQDITVAVTPDTLAGSDDWYQIPTVAEIAAGDIQILFTAWAGHPTTPVGHVVDVAGMWLTVNGT